MLIRLITTSALTSALALTIGSQAFAQTELAWWHGMTGANNEMVNELSKEFNESQSEYKIVPVYKGTYPETLNAGIAAFRSKQPPAILQVFDAGSGVMMAAEGAVVPAAEVLEKGGFKFDKSWPRRSTLDKSRPSTAPLSGNSTSSARSCLSGVAVVATATRCSRVWCAQVWSSSSTPACRGGSSRRVGLSSGR